MNRRQWAVIAGCCLLCAAMVAAGVWGAVSAPDRSPLMEVLAIVAVFVAGFWVGVVCVGLVENGVDDEDDLADAWDEGYARGVRDEAGEMERADNPYRAPA